MQVVVAIATTGRREVLSLVLRSLADQTRRPDLLILCPAVPKDDLDDTVLPELPFRSQVVTCAPAGLTRQRNAILREVKGDGVVVFFDDDFVPAPSFLAECEKAFEARPDMAMLTGEVLADGVYTPGIPFEEALATLAADRPPAEPVIDDIYNCYGCNMALRPELARSGGVEFDEDLPLYGWLEDVDFSRRMASLGRIMKTTACRGVHLATKKGKGSGRRLGYSQVANPFYLWRKQTMSPSRAAVQAGRNIAANLSKVWRPEPWVDRRGRIVGNVAAFADLLSGRLDPRKISSM
jgi:glycosyltransferase involved in cell wall biosynthesis